jgi:mRNA interferase YafQ
MAKKKPPPMSEPKPPLKVVEGTRFVKQLELQRKRGKDLKKLVPIVIALSERRPLEPRHRDHAMTGDWIGSRECHVEPDWLLIYEVDAATVTLLATGTHSDLFG